MFLDYSNIEIDQEKLYYPMYKNDNNLIVIHDNTEMWRDITELVVPRIQPWYMISNKGRCYSKATNQLLKTQIINSGYERIQFRSLDNFKLDCLVHRMVLETFDPIPEMKELQVNHKDTIKTHNWLGNLEWMTQSENMLHMYRNNLRDAGYNHMLGGVYTEPQIRQICELIVLGHSNNSICGILDLPDVARATILQIRKGNNWKQISREYGIIEDI